MGLVGAFVFFALFSVFLLDLCVWWDNLMLFFTPEWRNWQTRCVQVAVTARSWGFKSLLRYHFRYSKNTLFRERVFFCFQAGTNTAPPSSQ